VTVSWGREIYEEEQPWTWPASASPPPPPPEPEPAAESSPQVEASTQYASPPTGTFDGSIFWRGVSGFVDEIGNLDYWTLRQRSAALFYSNMYARGMLRRYVTNVIHTGLRPEWRLNHEILGITKEQAKAYAKLYEQRYDLYCNSPEIVDAKGTRSEGDLQAQIYLEALINGDCLVINRQDPFTGLPQIQIVNGDRVQTPPEHALDPNVIDGVRIDNRGRHVGYYVYKGTVDVWDDRYEYIPVHGANSGRKVAWLVYGCDKREDGVRGEPLLGIVVQGLNDISGYKGSSLLKAKINAMIVGSVKNTTGALPSLPISQGAGRQHTVATDPKDSTRKVRVNELFPGFWAEELSQGEEFSAYAISGSDVNFGPFEAAIVAGMAWALQIPPEILTLSFHKAFNASQAALNEWIMFLMMERARFSVEHCQNMAEGWQVSEVLIGKIEAPGFIDAYYNPQQYDVKRAWIKVEWIGSVKPTTDMKKQGQGFEIQVKNGWNTNDRISRAVNGTKFADNVEILEEENAMLAKAMRPLLELQQQFGADKVKDVAALAGIHIGGESREEKAAA
jgi:capsid protein